MSDVVIVGGGVIGLSAAYELVGQGASVTVLEQGQFGQEASWAGAGMLLPGNRAGARTPEAELRSLSASLWPALSAHLRETTGIDNGYRNCGGMHLSFDHDDSAFSREFAHWQREGVQVEPLTGDAARTIEPALSPELHAAFRLPGLGQVRNPRHLKALFRACSQRGVRLMTGTPVVDWEIVEGRVLAARSLTGTHSADQFVITTGAWSQHLLERAGVLIEIAPVRGQMVLLNAPALPFQHVLEVGPRYLVPRADGRVLVGSTEEHVGFEKRNTAEGVRGLIEFAERLVPALKQASVERFWSGLRPHSASGLPVIDRVPQTANLFVAAGHFRAGLQMSAGTAVVLRQLMLGQATEISQAAFGVSFNGKP